MPILYEHPLSPYVQKCKIALREKGVAFEARRPPGLGSGDTSADTTFARASPRGEVPALVADEISIFGSAAILEYLDDRWPEPAMLPAAPDERARVRMLADVMDSHYEPNNWAMSEITAFRRATGELAEQLMASAASQCRAWFAYLEGQLGDRAWFNGDAFGYGDLTVIPYVNGSAGFGIHPPRGSRLAAWAERANGRESVAATNAEAAEAAPELEQVAALVTEGRFRRQYRDHRLEWMIRSGGLEIVLDGLDRDTIRFNEPFAS